MYRALPNYLGEEMGFEDSLAADFGISESNEIVPGRTWSLEQDRLFGEEIDDLEALQQAVYLALNTSRYRHLIYSFDYGNDLKNLLGKDNELIRVESERLIREALLFDDRIDSVENFAYEFAEDYVLVSFEVHSRFGSFESEVALVG